MSNNPCILQALSRRGASERDPTQLWNTVCAGLVRQNLEDEWTYVSASSAEQLVEEVQGFGAVAVGARLGHRDRAERLSLVTDWAQCRG